MRDRTAWRDDLRRLLDAAWTEPMPVSPAQFLEVELALYLADAVAPGSHAEVVPALLAGYALAPGESELARVAVGAGRHLLATFKSPHEWRRALAAYRRVPSRWRGYEVDDVGAFERREVSSLTQRWHSYATALARAPVHGTDGINMARPGRYLAVGRRSSVTIEIPETLRASEPPPTYGEGGRRQRSPVVADWGELVLTARWIDQREEALGLTLGKWEQRLSRCRLLLYEDSLRTFAENDVLRIDGLMSMAGMVSSGKSTLRDVLTVWAAQRQRRVVVIVGDVATALRTSAHLRAIGMRAAPLLGRTNRSDHIARWHRIHQEAHPDLGALELDDPEFDFLGTACALDGLREASEPISLTELPCERLSPDSAHGELACPILPKCPIHSADLAALAADIWIATPASLVYSRPPRLINPRRMRYTELALRQADLVIVDEADAVQVQLDDVFTPSQTLAGSSEDSWLDRLEAKVSDELTSRARGQLSDQSVSSWRTALRTAASAVDGIYRLLQQEPLVARWLGRSYFQEWGLALKLASDWTATKPEDASSQRDILLAEFERCYEQLHGEGGADHPLASIAAEAVGSLEHDRLRTRMAEWIAARPGVTLDEEQLRAASLRLELTLLVAVLAGNLQFVYRQWHQVESLLALEGVAGTFSQGPPRDYEALLPDAPMGNVFGFQYLAPGERTGRGGKLRSFRCAGVGRYLLLGMPDLLHADRVPGPNVLVLSGTSWAGSSPTHHLNLPVTALLAPPPSELEAIGRSHFEFLPVLDSSGRPIAVSGAGQDRDPALARMISSLAERSGDGQLSQLESELNLLPHGRRRILLVVNSYEQTRMVGRELEEWPYWRGRAAVLLPDTAQDSSPGERGLELRRGQVEGFASTAADILVAPLLAIERGHNILNEVGEAALGAAYFLVRPHPQPDDIGFAVHSINRWAVENGARWSSGPLDTLARRHMELRKEARGYWHHLISLPIRYQSLPDRERRALSWTQLVAMVQVIGRLVRGGVPARVHFCDAAFAPSATWPSGAKSGQASLLASFVDILEPYLAAEAGSARDRAVADALYRPFFEAFRQLRGTQLATV